VDAAIELEQKHARLVETLGACESLMVAYSGGTDSAYLAFAAHEVLGDRMLAVIADSASLPRKELAEALAFSERHGIPTRVLQTEELAREDYQKNDGQRCFFCKDELFAAMEEMRARDGYAFLAFGMNVDDKGEHRPGQQAARNHHVLAPLVVAELHKSEIRELARRAGLELHAKPASACLASRLAYGLPVTAERLLQVERAEEALHALGFGRVRVRHHDTMARIEIDREEMPRALTMEMMEQMGRTIRALGFKYVAVDAEGYRSGSMNAVLPISEIGMARS